MERNKEMNSNNKNFLFLQGFDACDKFKNKEKQKRIFFALINYIINISGEEIVEDNQKKKLSVY